MPDAGRILARLVIGRAPAGPEDVDVLQRTFGLTAVLSLQTDHDLSAAGCSWEQVRGWWRARGITAERVPIEDWSPQAVLAHLDEAVQALDRLLAAGHTVYLHCTEGINRSPSVALGYLRQIRREPLGKALRRVTARRPQANPYPEVLERLRRPNRGT